MKPAFLSSLSALARQACGGLLLLLLGHSVAWAQQPAAASIPRLDWSDVTRFWQTMDRLALATSRADSLQLVQTQYLDPASAGLRAYVEAAHATPADLLATWRTHRQYLAAIRPATLQIKAQEPAIRQAVRELKKVYPAAIIPAVYFGIGKFEVGGTAFPGALYIGAELKCTSPHPPLEELRPDVRPSVSAVTTVSTPCIHEIIHVQQRLRDGTTNLDGALLEGAAEYLAYRFTGRLGATAAFAYGNQHEAEVRHLFVQEASQPITAKWFVATTEAGSSLPGALGYFVGFKICEAYYAQAADKPAALRQLLTLSQPAELLDFGRNYLSR